jgi:hypothetical protein
MICDERASVDVSPRRCHEFQDRHQSERLGSGEKL